MTKRFERGIVSERTGDIDAGVGLDVIGFRDEYQPTTVEWVFDHVTDRFRFNSSRIWVGGGK